MGTWDVDFDDYEEKAGYSGEAPKPGIYSAKLTSVKEHTTSDDALVFTFDITEGEFQGWRGYVYANMSSAKWKVQQIAKAIQGGGEKPMSMNPANESGIIKKAKPVRIQIKNEMYEGEKRGKIRTILPDEAAAKMSKVADKAEKEVDPWETSDDE